MRSSDWSSDVCSSNLDRADVIEAQFLEQGAAHRHAAGISICPPARRRRAKRGRRTDSNPATPLLDTVKHRNRVVSGKSVFVRVDTSGRQLITKHTTTNTINVLTRTINSTTTST